MSSFNELPHFNVPNHGKLWKSLMTAYLGDYERLERRLSSGYRDDCNNTYFV